MPSIVKNKMTTSVIFNRSGVPNSDKTFAYRATQNYSVLKNISRYYTNNGLTSLNTSNVFFSHK